MYDIKASTIIKVMQAYKRKFMEGIEIIGYPDDLIATKAQLALVEEIELALFTAAEMEAAAICIENNTETNLGGQVE